MEKPEDKPFSTEETIVSRPENFNPIKYECFEDDDSHICELSGRNVIPVRNGSSIFNISVKDMFLSKDTSSYEVMLGTEWKPCRIRKVARGNTIEVSCLQGYKVILGPKHLQKVYRNGENIIVEASDIDTADVLNFNNLYMPAFEVEYSSMPEDIYSIDTETDGDRASISFNLGNSFTVHDFNPDEFNDT